MKNTSIHSQIRKFTSIFIVGFLIVVLSASCGEQTIPHVNQSPSVSLKADKTNGQAPLTVNFTATSSDPDNDPISITWDFGDSNSAQGQNSRSHTFQAAGSFTVKVTVSDGKGGTDSDSLEIVTSSELGKLSFVENSLVARCNALNQITVFGEVENTTSSPYYFIAIKSVYRNKAGVIDDVSTGYLVGSPIKYEYGITSGLQPNAKGFFKIYMDTKCDEAGKGSLSISSFTKGGTSPKGDIRIIGQVNRKTNALNYTELLGEVTNSGTVRTKFSQIYAVFKDSNGNIVEVANTFVKGSTCAINIGTTDTCIEVGAKEVFKILTTIQPSQFRNIEYFFDWNED